MAIDTLASYLYGNGHLDAHAPIGIGPDRKRAAEAGSTLLHPKQAPGGSSCPLQQEGIEAHPVVLYHQRHLVLLKA